MGRSRLLAFAASSLALIAGCATPVAYRPDPTLIEAVPPDMARAEVAALLDRSWQMVEFQCITDVNVGDARIEWVHLNQSIAFRGRREPYSIPYESIDTTIFGSNGEFWIRIASDYTLGWRSLDDAKQFADAVEILKAAKRGAPRAARPAEQPTLLSCPACDGKVSSQAAACPHCGQPMTDGR